MRLFRNARAATRMLVSGDRLDRLAVVQRLSRLPVLGVPAKRYLARASSLGSDRYAAMQRATYEGAALGDADAVAPGDLGNNFVVATWREHNDWADYEEYLMRYVPDAPTWIALDFGCGPGRNILRWSERFARIDGADIAHGNLDNARVYLGGLSPEKRPNLYLTNGDDCGAAPNDAYDFVFSTVVLQHICVHSTRDRIFRSIYRCLKPGGRIAIQMGFGVPSPRTVDYYADSVDAQATNGECDVAIASDDQPRQTLEGVGFTAFEHWVTPVGPADHHPNWIFFTALKPQRTSES